MIKSVIIISLLIFLPDFSFAMDKVKKEKAKEKKEKAATVKQKFDTRSREQRRKDRNMLILMTVAGFLVFLHIDGSE